MLPAEKTFRVQDQAVEEHELAVDLRVEERHLRIVRGRICHSTSTGSAHQITSWSSLVRSDQRRCRKTPTRRRRYVAVCRILSSEHLLPLLTDLCLFEVTVAVTVRSIRGQRTPGGRHRSFRLTGERSGERVGRLTEVHGGRGRRWSSVGRSDRTLVSRLSWFLEGRDHADVEPLRLSRPQSRTWLWPEFGKTSSDKILRQTC